jgi:hypothetical protein
MGQLQYLGVGVGENPAKGYSSGGGNIKNSLQRPSAHACSTSYSTADSNEGIGMLSTSSSRIMDVGIQPASYAVPNAWPALE